MCWAEKPECSCKSCLEKQFKDHAPKQAQDKVELKTKSS